MDLNTDIAIDKVRDNNKEYYLRALDFAQSFVKMQMRPFSSEDVKTVFYKLNEEPRESRIWGAVMRELSRDKLILFHGYQAYRNPSGHCRPSTVWISREYSEKQKQNRQANGKTQIKLEL